MPITSSDQAKITKKQHTTPCHDCPFRRVSIPGWLGDIPAQTFINIALSDERYDCHTKKTDKRKHHQCAGMATFRANLCKAPRDPEVLQLKADREKVFARPGEFLSHHYKLNLND
jgi:hypothetical protein